MKRILLTLLVASLSWTAQAKEKAPTTTRWEIDPHHTAAQFAVRHLMVSAVRGAFTQTTGALVLDEKDIGRSTLEVTIDASSIDTRVEKRDEHLRSEDFFHTEKHPTITFKSTKVQKAGKGLKVTGDLTMRGVTKPVTLNVSEFNGPVQSPWGQTVRGVKATTKINRKDWGIAWNQKTEAGVFLIGEEVELVIDAELILSK